MRTRVFAHTYTVQTPLDQVLALFHTPTVLAQMTPSPVSVRFQTLPARLATGATMKMRIGVGPLTTEWIARFTDVSATRFVDEQIKGPFPVWIHEHEFLAVTPDTTEIRDRITVSFRTWDILCLFMWLGLPLLFLFRRWRTPGLLARHHTQ